MLNDVVDHAKYSAKMNTVMTTTVVVASHFLPRRRGHLAHFGAHVVVERPDRSGQDFTRHRSCRRLPQLNSPSSSSRLPSLFLALPFSPKTLAGAEGFEPPSSVLETDSLTVELTPLFPLSHLRLSHSSDWKPRLFEISDRPIGNRTIAHLFHFFMRRVLAATVGRIS